MEKNAKGNRETLPNPFLILKPAVAGAQTCFRKHGHYVNVEIFTGLFTGKILVTCSYYSGVHKHRLNCILIRSLCVFYEIIRGPYVILSTPTVTCLVGLFIAADVRCQHWSKDCVFVLDAKK